jgi:hypothetical protein
VSDCKATFTGAATDVRGGAGFARGAAAVMAGESLASIRQGPHPAAANGLAALTAIDEAGTVAAMRALESCAVEFTGVIGILLRHAAQHAAGFDLTPKLLILVDPGDLEAMGRA